MHQLPGAIVQSRVCLHARTQYLCCKAAVDQDEQLGVAFLENLKAAQVAVDLSDLGQHEIA